MNRIWKTLFCVCLFMIMFFSSGPVNAEPKAIAGDWPPASGAYVRKTASGILNGRIDVITVDLYNNPAVIVGVESRNYKGNRHEGSDMAPRIYIAGHMDAGPESAEVILTCGYTDKRNPVPSPELLPPMTRVVYDAKVNNKIITLEPRYFDGAKTRPMSTDPDLAGAYIFESPYYSPSAFMAVAWVRLQNPQLTGLQPGLAYRYEDNFVADGMEKNYPGIGPVKPSYELKFYEGDKLFRTFLVSQDFHQICRIKPDGEAMFIYNSEGGVG